MKQPTRMKILLTSDWHVDATTAGRSRFAESEAYVDELVRAVKAHGVDVVCFLGDAFDPGSMFEGMWSTFMIDAHYRLTKASRLGSVFITGNHDVLDTSSPMSTLSPLRRAIEINSEWERSVAGARLTTCAETPSLMTYGNVAILALPYYSRLYARAGYEDEFLAAIARAHEAKNAGRRLVVIGHYTIPGIHPGSEGEMMRGRDIPFPTNVIEQLAPDLIVNGHYHARQTVRLGALTIEIVGAPTRFTFGEADDGARGYLIAEV